MANSASAAEQTKSSALRRRGRSRPPQDGVPAEAPLPLVRITAITTPAELLHGTSKLSSCAVCAAARGAMRSSARCTQQGSILFQNACAHEARCSQASHRASRHANARLGRPQICGRLPAQRAPLTAAYLCVRDPFRGRRTPGTQGSNWRNQNRRVASHSLLRAPT